MSSRVGVNLRASAYLHQGDRKYMEDEFQVAYQRTHDKKDIEYAFFGIFDGHGGKEAAHFAKDNLMDNIVSLRAFWSDDDEDVLAAIKEGFLQTHMAMWKVLDQWPRTASGWPSTSGTTASVAFIRRQKIYIGHVGDSGIVLGCEDQDGGWHGEALTRDHKPESIAEKQRITECGGKVINKSGVPRVVWNRPKSGHQGPVRRSTPMDEIPFLAVARSLGDLWSYNATNDQFVVSPEPDVCVMPIDIKRHRCLIFGTDGLWNVLTPDSAVSVAHSAEKNNEKHYLGIPTSCGKQRLWVNPSRSVVSGALGRYLKLNLRADNTSAVTVFLDPPGRPKREVLLQQKGMKKGSPTKQAAVRRPAAEEERNREATVKVHVYNQSQVTRHEGNRGVLKIKERLPEKWQTNPNDPNQEGMPEGAEANPGCSRAGDGSMGCGEGSEGDDGMDDMTKVGCSECGCDNVHAVASTSSDSAITTKDDVASRLLPPTSQALPPSMPSETLLERISECLPEKLPVSENKCAVENKPDMKTEGTTVGAPDTTLDSKPPQDDIQIPVVSSSTMSPSLDARGKKGRGPAGRGKSLGPNQTQENNNDGRRRTRSNIHVPSAMEIENKEQTPIAADNNNEWKGESREETAGTSTKAVKSMSSVSSVDPANRVLKLVNRSSMETANPTAPKAVTPKRKRGNEVEAESVEEQPTSKSARIHTRSHTWSHKPMVTRSQEKTHQTPKKVRKSATPRK